MTASSGLSQDRIIVAWDDEQRANEYIVYRSERPDGPYTQIATSNTKTLTDRGVIAGVDYYYKVKATNLAGESKLSLSAKGRLADGPIPISDLTIDLTGADYAQLSFSAPSDALRTNAAVKAVRNSLFKISTNRK